MSSAGKFRIVVGQPYPCLIQVIYNDVSLPAFTHDELRDLKHAVDMAIREAIVKLPNKSKNEV